MDRNTRQQGAVLDALLSSREALTPPEILALAQREVPRLSLSTVYRRLKSLQAEHRVQRVDLPGRSTRYEAAVVPSDAGMQSVDHHHHFHCNGCERVFRIHGCPGPMQQLAPTGFRVDGHEITLHGRCPACISAGAACRGAGR